ncbi:hypothetical protein T4E_3983 [Trichinella pseudospiralis]|uniref:Uncharacterized protein n=1 Tax=Trichinella pseudospiralis TaxID=6337 RepID=A0A0V0YCK8_TRIPS|nr:hypothetical protein T4E_3983 [Trichinella pseudospiralis]
MLSELLKGIEEIHHMHALYICEQGLKKNFFPIQNARLVPALNKPNHFRLNCLGSLLIECFSNVSSVKFVFELVRRVDVGYLLQ